MDDSNEQLATSVSELALSDLDTNTQLSSGQIPDLSFGLSLTDSTTINNNTALSHTLTQRSVKTHLPLLNLVSFPVPHGNEAIVHLPCDNGHSLKLSDAFPGVNAVLNKMVETSTQDTIISHDTDSNNRRMDHTKQAKAPPLLMITNNIFENQNENIPHQPIFFAPPPIPHCPMTSLIGHSPSLNTPSLTSHTQHQYEFILPNIPLKPFVPKLIPPSMLSDCLSRTAPVPAPPLFVINDPVSRMRRDGFQLLKLPDQQEKRLIQQPLNVEQGEDTSKQNNGDKEIEPVRETNGKCNESSSIKPVRGTNVKCNESLSIEPVRGTNVKCNESPSIKPVRGTNVKCNESSSIEPVRGTNVKCNELSSESDFSHYKIHLKERNSSNRFPSQRRRHRKNRRMDKTIHSSHDVIDDITDTSYDVITRTSKRCQRKENENPSSSSSSTTCIFSSNSHHEKEDHFEIQNGMNEEQVTHKQSKEDFSVSPQSSSPNDLQTTASSSNITSPVVPVKHSIATQVDITTHKLSVESTSLSVVLPQQQRSVESQTEAGHEYLVVADIEDDYSEEEDDFSDSKEREELVKQKSESKMEDKMKKDMLYSSCDEEMVHSYTQPDTRGSGNVLKSFDQLEYQLTAIEHSAIGLEEEFISSRKLLDTIDKLNTRSENIVPRSYHHRPHPLDTKEPLPVEEVVIPDDPEVHTIPHPLRDKTNDDRHDVTHQQRVGYMREVCVAERKRKDLKKWMISKRKERLSEYLTHREELRNKERQPYIPNMKNRISDKEFTDNSLQRRRSLQRSNHIERLHEAHSLMVDLLTKSKPPLQGSRYNTSLDGSSNITKTLSQINTRSHNLGSSGGLSSSTALEGRGKFRRDGKMEGRKEMLGSKRRLSSIEGLNELEQFKMAEILASTEIDQESISSIGSVISSIDWNQVDEILDN